MPETEAFDPIHALDGWRPPAPAPSGALRGLAERSPGRARLGHAGRRA